MSEPHDRPRLPTLTIGLVVRGADRAIAFYERALGAKLLLRMDSPDGKSVWHAHLQVGDSHVFLGDEMPGGTRPAPSREEPIPNRFWVSVADCDDAHRRAVDAGASPVMPPTDMFWGDRVAEVVDPFGYVWSFSQHVRDPSPEEMKAAGEAFARQWAAKQRG